MHILLTTYGLLLIFALFCTAQWRSATDMAFMDTVAIERFTQFRKKMFAYVNNESRNQYNSHKPKNNQKPVSKAIASKIDSTVAAPESALLSDAEEEDAPIESPDAPEEPQNTKEERCFSFLRIGDIFKGENPSVTEGKGKAAFTLLKNLLKEMYQGQRFYEEAKEQLPDLEELFLLSLFDKAKEEQQEEEWIHDVDDLATIELDDPLQSYIRYKIFTGNKSRYEENSEEESGYYPLLEFTTMSTGKSVISLWLAPKPLLMALFQNTETVEELLQARKEMYYELKNGKRTAPDLANDLRLRFSTSIREIDPQYVNFNVSKTYRKDLTQSPNPKTKKKSA